MAGFAEITIEQGADYSSTITVNDSTGTPQNLTSYTAASQLRKSYYSSTAKSFVVNVTNPTAGEITTVMSSANTANLSPGRYVYDVVIKDTANTVTRVLEGIVNVIPQVTVF